MKKMQDANRGEQKKWRKCRKHFIRQAKHTNTSLLFNPPVALVVQNGLISGISLHKAHLSWLQKRKRKVWPRVFA